MSGRFTTRKYERALLCKGFASFRGARHGRLALVVAGEVTCIHTLVSRTNYTVDDKLAARMAFQLRMPGISYLRRFVECEVSGEEYGAMLRESGVI